MWDDWFNQIQTFRIVTDSVAEGSVIANNYASNNDVALVYLEQVDVVL